MQPNRERGGDQAAAAPITPTTVVSSASASRMIESRSHLERNSACSRRRRSRPAAATVAVNSRVAHCAVKTNKEEQ